MEDQSNDTAKTTKPKDNQPTFVKIDLDTVDEIKSLRDVFDNVSIGKLFLGMKKQRMTTV